MPRVPVSPFPIRNPIIDSAFSVPTQDNTFDTDGFAITAGRFLLVGGIILRSRAGDTELTPEVRISSNAHAHE